jgi:hypothetical protein
VIRRANGDADLERCVEIFDAVHPEDRLALRDLKEPSGYCLLHDGSGTSRRSAGSSSSAGSRQLQAAGAR